MFQEDARVTSKDLIIILGGVKFVCKIKNANLNVLANSRNNFYPLHLIPGTDSSEHLGLHCKTTYEDFKNTKEVKIKYSDNVEVQFNFEVL